MEYNISYSPEEEVSNSEAWKAQRIQCSITKQENRIKRVHVDHQNIEAIIMDLKERNNDEPEDTVSKQNCTCIHLKDNLENISPKTSWITRVLTLLNSIISSFGSCSL